MYVGWTIGSYMAQNSFFLLASTPLIFGQDNKRTPLYINKHYRMFQYEKDIEIWDIMTSRNFFSEFCQQFWNQL